MSSSTAQPFHDAFQYDFEDGGGANAREGRAMLRLSPNGQLERHQGRGLVQASLTASLVALAVKAARCLDLQQR